MTIFVAKQLPTVRGKTVWKTVTSVEGFTLLLQNSNAEEIPCGLEGRKEGRGAKENDQERGFWG